MAVTRRAFCNNIWCDAASDLPAAGKFTGQIAWINDSPVVVKRWSGAAWVSVTPTFGAGSVKYDPWTTPTSGLDASSSDEFFGSIDTGILTWGNQGTATLTAELDTARLHTAASASIDRKCVWYTMPSGNWVMSTALSHGAFNVQPLNFIAGLCVLETGTIGTPTSIFFAMSNRANAALHNFSSYTSTSYTAAYALVATGQWNQQPSTGWETWHQIRYVSATKTLQHWAGWDGFNFYPVDNGRALGAHPTHIGFFADQNTANFDSDVRFHFLRTRTDATGTSSPFPVGE